MKRGKDGRSVPREELERLRFHALELRKKGWKVKDIAESFGFQPNSVSRWFVKTNRYGKNSLKGTKAQGCSPKLSKDDKEKITAWLKKSAIDFGFETPLWTCKRVRQQIKI